jgi:hypothetical protein
MLVGEYPNTPEEFVSAKEEYVKVSNKGVGRYTGPKPEDK